MVMSYVKNQMQLGFAGVQDDGSGYLALAELIIVIRLLAC